MDLSQLEIILHYRVFVLNIIQDLFLKTVPLAVDFVLKDISNVTFFVEGFLLILDYFHDVALEWISGLLGETVCTGLNAITSSFAFCFLSAFFLFFLSVGFILLFSFSFVFVKSSYFKQLYERKMKMYHTALYVSVATFIVYCFRLQDTSDHCLVIILEAITSIIILRSLCFKSLGFYTLSLFFLRTQNINIKQIVIVFYLWSFRPFLFWFHTCLLIFFYLLNGIVD
jgi:hypothetical protein